ncbi:hypothetical protein IQ37_14680 [Chryseobacterium piperi]|uniref:Uncharacterized protein n=1 Tax=Chryseobacterium piperi TaxID=558152 RepID=A0A086B2I8_9FLAO|nr:hypothetical protein [Chryseobacterium piperi]ASW73076.2 hypothetical protein CJF12_01415 [Chryseobacterium piperi]KFF23152.1 hypothetical protein IQ37_14680 [Chryseobacterium piperi]
MKTRFIILFSLFSIGLYFSQEKEDKRFFPVEYILKNSNDTIKGKIRNTGYFTNKKYYFATIMFKMKMRSGNGEETWVQPNDVKYIKITDENNIKHEYFASTEKLPKDEGLIEIMYEGKHINWYKGYRNPVLGTQLEIRGYITDKDKNLLYSGFFYDFKGKFKKMLKDDLDLEAKLKAAKTDEEYVEVFRLYDAKIDKP